MRMTTLSRPQKMTLIMTAESKTCESYLKRALESLSDFAINSTVAISFARVGLEKLDVCGISWWLLSSDCAFWANSSFCL